MPGLQFTLGIVLAALACLASAPAFAQAAPSPQATAEPSDGPKFEIRRFVFDGARLISTAELESVTNEFRGRERSFGDVQRALEAIEKLYGTRGYSAVQIVLPEQELDMGEVRFSVVEATLGRLVVEGNKFFDEANIRASLPALQPGMAPNINQIARNLRVANENPAKQTTVLLRSGQQEGTVDAVARVVDEGASRAGVTVDTSGTHQTGIVRVGFGYQNGNLFNRDHVLNLQYVGAPYRDEHPNQLSLVPSSKVLVLGAGYRIPLYGNGDSIDLSAGYSNVNSGTVANLFTISGSGGLLGVRYTKNLDRVGDYEHRAVFSWDYRGYINKGVRPVGGTEQLTPDVTVHPISLTYSGLYRGQDSETGFSGGFSQNLPGGNDGGGKAFSLSRADGYGQVASGHYLIWRWGVNHNRALPADWQMRAAMNGQLTRYMLVSGEQFGIGGADSVRGFLEREVTNDNGYRGTLELYSPDWGSWTGIGGARARALLFYDWGAVRRIKPAADDPHGQHISSAGIGVRFSSGVNLSLRIDYAIVQDRGGSQGPGEGRLHASFSYLF